MPTSKKPAQLLEIEQLLALMEKHNLLELSVGEIHLKKAPSVKAVPVMNDKKKTDLSLTKADLNDPELIFWSAGQAPHNFPDRK